MTKTSRIALAILLLGMLLLGGCAQRGPTRDPAYGVTYPEEGERRTPLYGSIYENHRYVALFTDLKAIQVGDTLTVKLVEKTAASKKAETEIGQETDFTVENPTVFGMTPNMNAGRLSDNDITLENQFESTKEFEADAESEQSNSLEGDITVTVARVLANGNLVVHGEKLMTLNRGHEHIRFSGIVRPYDITPDNTVLSTKVANATIVYSGEGELADANKAGWWSRLFLKYFPY
ncbi:MAG: flagellar basal body L-ring protein FlgH [Gammaproteobacteria bacterium]|nr:flagellar basal body L-ring protein FlgH [Gammaproteobacteria bacterium]